MGGSVLMRPVLTPLTAEAVSEHSLHNSFPTLVQMLQVRQLAIHQVLCLFIMQLVCLTIMQRGSA